MKHVLLLPVALLVLLAISASQISSQVQPVDSGYVVKPGDTIWELAGTKLDDPYRWVQVFEQNPFLKEPGRRFNRNGKVIVVIKPGEKLSGLEKLGIVPTAVPLSELKVIQAVQPPEEPIFSWMVVLIVVLFVIYMVFDWWYGRQNPVTGGEPMVRGGVMESNAVASFQAAAQRIYASEYGGAAPAAALFTVLPPVVRGRGFGTVLVNYRDKRKPLKKRLNGEPIYRARVQSPNGREQEIYMLQGCGNDLRFGGISGYTPGKDFQFAVDGELPLPRSTPAPVVAEVPSPAPAAPQPSVPTPQEVVVTITNGEAVAVRSSGPWTFVRIGSAEVSLQGNPNIKVVARRVEQKNQDGHHEPVQSD